MTISNATQPPKPRILNRLKWMALGGCGTTAIVAGVLVIFLLTKHLHVHVDEESQSSGSQLSHLPVTVTFREALLSRGAVAQITNGSNSPLQQVTVLATNAGLQKSHPFLFPVLEPHRTVKIGWHEGWDFSPGDSVTVQSPGYDDYKLILNR